MSWFWPTNTVWTSVLPPIHSAHAALAFCSGISSPLAWLVEICTFGFVCKHFLTCVILMDYIHLNLTSMKVELS